MTETTASPMDNIITIDDERIKKPPLKAIHASEEIAAAREKTVRVAEKLRALRLTNAAESWKWRSRRHFARESN